MATWSDVELLTNEDTNTVRLGSVSREENGSGLYQVDTLVKISTANEVMTVDVYSTRTRSYIPVAPCIYNTLTSRGPAKEDGPSVRIYSLPSVNAQQQLVMDPLRSVYHPTSDNTDQ